MIGGSNIVFDHDEISKTRKQRKKETKYENISIMKHYERLMINLALSQFEWTGDIFTGENATCDRHYLEHTLLYAGTACFLKPSDYNGNWMTLDYNVEGRRDVYGRPTKITGLGYNAERINTNEYMVLFDNSNRLSIIPQIRLYAKRMYEIHMTAKINMEKQNTPFIMIGDGMNKLTSKNIINSILNFESVVGINNKSPLKDIDVLNLNVPFLGTELQNQFRAIWEEALTMLGISTGTQKQERMLLDEVSLNRQEDLTSLNSRYLNRREFVEKFNKKHDQNIGVKLASIDTERSLQYGGIHDFSNGGASTGTSELNITRE